MIGKAKSIYFLLAKSFKKQTIIVEDQEIKQIDAIMNQKQKQQRLMMIMIMTVKIYLLKKNFKKLSKKTD